MRPSSSRTSHSRLAGSIWSSTSRVSRPRDSPGRARRRLADHDDSAVDGFLVVVAVEVGHAGEIENGEAGLVDVRRLAGPAAAHLAVEDGAAGEPRHDQVDDLGAVEAGVEHVHADEDLRELLVLEAADDGGGIGVGRGAAAGVADDEIGVADGGVGLPVGERRVEQIGEVRRVALRHREDDGLAPGGCAQHFVAAAEAVLQHVAELVDDGAVARGDGECALQRAGVDEEGVGGAERVLQLGAVGGRQRVPVDLVARDLETAIGGGLDGGRAEDAVGGQHAFPDGLGEAVGEGGRLEVEESAACRGRRRRRPCPAPRRRRPPRRGWR